MKNEILLEKVKAEPKKGQREKVYKVGVLGLGEGRSILSAITQSSRWELVNMCDLNEALCRERQKEFNAPRYTTNYEDMLSDPSIDVIAIYTPDQLHGTHIIQALNAGKHVICTKPLLDSLDQADAVLAAQKKADKQVFVGQSSRFFEPMLHQRKDYDAGNHGQLLLVEAQYITDARWFLDKGWSTKKGFSWMHNFMIHAVDLVRWYLPDIEEVFGYGVVSENTRAFNMDVPDALTFVAKSKSGAHGLIKGSYTAPALGRDVEPTIGCVLRGSQGMSRAEYSKLRYYSRFADQTLKEQTFDDKHGYYFRFEGESHHAGEYQNYIDYFASCLDAGETPLPDAREGVETLAVIAAMEKSIKLGRPVKISEITDSLGL